MSRRAVVTVSFVACLIGAPACRDRAPADRLSSGPTIAAAASSPAPAVSSSAPPSLQASASSPPEPLVTCGAACAPGTTCHLTKDGPACVACGPGSVPSCKDDRFVVTCDERGVLQTLTDCAAHRKRCDRGRCAAPECTPNEPHCFEGDVYRCSADGNTREIVTKCVNVYPDGAIRTEKGLCQEKNGKPACRETCDLPDHTIIALRDCGACPWAEVSFCATESPERGCMDWICLPDHQYTAGAVSMPCWRDTDGLVVPGSDKAGPCEGASAIGTRKVTYEVCRDGKASPATRVEPCQR